MKVREIINRIEAVGWAKVKSRGGHRQFKHPTRPGRVTISGGLGDDMPIGTLKNVEKQSGVRLT